MTIQLTETDSRMMQTALSLAWQGRFSTSPNPRVGCVIAQGEHIIGQGFHVSAGEPHAEIHALKQAGERARGATAYVTLEPCSHHGRTPPCANALVAAGIAKVVVAMTDPNPLVSGQGLAILAAAGITTTDGLFEAQARELNRGFLSRIERQRPFIKLKCAASLDGKTALSNGQSQWITGEAAREDVQILRAESCAILTGIGTILADNPQLNVRSFPTLRQPTRIILDTRLRTPLDSHVIKDSGSPTLILTAANEQYWKPYLQHQHVTLLKLPESNSGLDLFTAMTQLAHLGYGEIMLEAGSILGGAFLSAGLVDELVLYQSPKILGQAARSLFSLPESPHVLLNNPSWQTTSISTIGNDIKWVLQPAL